MFLDGVDLFLGASCATEMVAHCRPPGDEGALETVSETVRCYLNGSRSVPVIMKTLKKKDIWMNIHNFFCRLEERIFCCVEAALT